MTSKARIFKDGKNIAVYNMGLLCRDQSLSIGTPEIGPPAFLTKIEFKITIALLINMGWRPLPEDELLEYVYINAIGEPEWGRHAMGVHCHKIRKKIKRLGLTIVGRANTFEMIYG